MQDQLWGLDWAVEGDRWWARNRQALLDPTRSDRDIILMALERNRIEPKRVLEVGASNGWRLEAIRQRYGADCFGIDTSPAAIGDGRQLFPAIHLDQGTIYDLLVWGGNIIDCLLVPFVLHWVERFCLSLVVNQIDRKLAEGSYLIVDDFLPDVPTRARYHHRQDVEAWTYKQDYAQCWLALGLYREVDRIVFNHDTGQVGDVPSDQRAACVVLQKASQYR